MLDFSTVSYCPASPVGFVEIADCCDIDPSAVALMSASEILAHPHVRALSPDDAAEAKRVWESDDE